MANIKSAKKRISVNDRQKQENKFFKATVNTYIKKFRKLVREGNFEEAEKQLKETISLINSSASKGIYHKNNASRKISRLSSALYVAKNGKNQTAATEVKPVEVVEEVKPQAEVVEQPAKKTVRKTTAKNTESAAEEKPAVAKKVKVEEKPAATKKAATTTAKKAESTTKKTTAKTKKAE